jgi:hypothetical protein
MALLVAHVPSYKWLPLTYQLSSRLGTHPPAKRYRPDDDDDDDAHAAASAAAATAAGEDSAGSPTDKDFELGPLTTFAQVLP